LTNEAQQEINGNGLGLKKVGRAVRKVGRVAMKSGVADFIIDEAVGTLPIQAIAKRAVASVVKQQVRQFTGAGINQIDLQNNPYIPKLQSYGVHIMMHLILSLLIQMHITPLHI
jgi:hypothetical protein